MTLNGNETVSGTTILTKPVKMTKFDTKAAKIKGNILNYNFDDLIADTLFNDTRKKVTGHKTFTDSLFYHNLSINRINNVELNQLVEQINIWLSDIHINKPINIRNILKVDDVYFNDLNGLSRQDFGHVWLLKNGEQTIEKQQFFEKIHVKNKLTTDTINDMRVEELDEKAIKINEKHRIKSVEFGTNYK